VMKGGITNRAQLKKYLTKVFERFPKQTWGIDVEHAYDIQRPGMYSIYYKFMLYSKEDDQVPAYSGTGMERITMVNGQLTRDEIHLTFGWNKTGEALNSKNFDASKQLKIRNARALK